MRLRPRAERRSRRQQQRDALPDLFGSSRHAHVPRPDYGAQSGAHEAREGETMTQQALPPSVDQQLADARTASAQAQGRITELEAQVNWLRAERDALRAALIRWHHADGHDDFTDVDQDLADIAAALAARAGEGEA
jgi:hypothetical protein